MSNPSLNYISDCFINPKHLPKESNNPVYLSPFDLVMLSANYIQKGFLFAKPPSFDRQNQLPHFLTKLQESLSLTLVHFYPLSGRLSTSKQQDPPRYSVFIDCKNSPGARFIHASTNLTISDVLSPHDVPVEIAHSFFDHDKEVNHDGHDKSLLTIQVTELVDGIFIGCSFNHVVGDGTSFWHFLNSWSEVFKEYDAGKGVLDCPVSREPILERWFPQGHGPIISLPYTNPQEFIYRHASPVLRERFFHFSKESVAKLKAKANEETNTTNISSLQALSAHVWRCVTRARRLPLSQMTSCNMAIDNRTRLDPPLPPEYFGSCALIVKATATTSELLQEHTLGWAAKLLHQAVQNHTDKVVRQSVELWVQKPFVFQPGQFFDPCSVMMGSSPRFNMYGNEFGLGKAIALRSGYANKFDGKVSLYPGIEGGNSMNLEVCLLPDTMSALECDKEFMEFVSL